MMEIKKEKVYCFSEMRSCKYACPHAEIHKKNSECDIGCYRGAKCMTTEKYNKIKKLREKCDKEFKKSIYELKRIIDKYKLDNNR